MTSEVVDQIELIENIQCLFIQLRLFLTNPEDLNDTSTPAVILNNLTNICDRLLDRKYHTTDDVVIIFETLLKNYLLLLDSQEFVDVIARQYSLANNAFLSSLYHSISSDDVALKIGLAAYKIRMALFTRLLDQISSSTRITSFLKSEFLCPTNNNNNNEDIQRIVDNTCRILLMRILPVLSFTDVISIRLSVIKLKKYENSLFSLFIIFIERHFSENKPSENEILIKRILVFLYMISKQIATIPILINIECSIACLRWLSLSVLKSEEYKYILLILKNIASHDEGAEILNKNQRGEVFTKFTKEILHLKIDYLIDSSMHKTLLFTMNMIIFSTAHPSGLCSLYNCELICNALLPAITMSLSSRGYMDMECCTTELLIILMKLFTNDDILNYVLQKGTGLEFFFNTFKTILSATNNNYAIVIHSEELLLSIIVLANIFWSISFHEQYKKELIENLDLGKFEVFIDYVIAHTFLSRQIFPLRRTIDGIKQNLCPVKPSTISTTRSLMISYSYLDSDFYRKLYEILSKHSKLSISPDADNWKQTAQNIEQADLVLLIISNNFLTNKSCRQEFIYARDMLEKPCISVYINQEYKPIGWLRKQINGLKSIRFDQEDICDELMSIINETLSIETNSSGIKQWNDREVKQWFTNYNLLPELHEFYQFQNGNELFLYAQAISTHPWTSEYDRIKSRFERKFHEQEKYLSPHEFFKFINALDRVKHSV